MSFAKLFFTSLIIFLILDFLWLGLIAKNIYTANLGYIMASEVRWGAAIAFYLTYIFGLVVFVILPSWQNAAIGTAVLYGALYGLVCYATYDLTNLATIKDWPIKIVIYDLAWGAFVTALDSYITVWLGIHLRNLFR